MLEPWVLEILRCPRCGSRLAIDTKFLCSRCGSAYPLADGIPILLDEEKSLVAPSEVISAAATPAAGPVPRLLRTLLPAHGRSYGSRHNYEKLARLLAGSARETPRVLVVGGQSLGAGMEALLSAPVQLVETDVAIGSRTMIVCDAQQLPFADGSLDAVVIQAVLSLVPDPARAVAEVHRVLTERGLVYAENSFMQQVWGGAYDFHRWTDRGHRQLFRDFDELAGGMLDGPATALAWSWEFFLLSFGRSAPTRLLLRLVGRLTAFWLKHLDTLLARRPASIDGASGLFFLGRSAAQPIPDKAIVGGYRGVR